MNSNRSTHDVTLLEFCTQDDNIRHGDRAAELRISFSILNEYKLLPEDFKEHYKYLGFTAIDPNGLDWFSSVYLEAIHKKDSRYLMSQCIKRGLFEYSKEVLTENTLDVSETHIGMDKYYYADMMDISLSAQNRYRAYTRYIGKSNKMEAAFLSAKTQKQAKEILMQATTDDIRRVLHKLSKQMSDATADEVPLENMDCKELDKMAANIRLCTMELKDRQTSSLIVESKALKKSKEQEAKLSKEKAEQARAAAREADRAAREAAREAEKEVKATRSARTSQARTEKVMAQLRKNTEARIKAMREIREAIEIV
jgi:hypothetical protein